MRKIFKFKPCLYVPGREAEDCVSHPACHFQVVRRFSEALRGILEEEGDARDPRHAALSNLAFRAMLRVLIWEISDSSSPWKFEDYSGPDAGRRPGK